MRSLIVVCLLAGCYKPTTESCYYRCATQGTPCPSGLACVAGTCVTPGETCPTMGDGAMVDTGPDIDSPPPMCGDGTAMPGEFCYRTANAFPSTGMPLDGVLADRDGDGDLDLIFGTSTSYFAYLNTGNALSSSSVSGPASSPLRVMRAVNLDTTSSVEMIHATDNGIETYTYNSSTMNHTRVTTFSGVTSLITFAVANISGGPLADLVVLTGSELRVFSYNVSYTLNQVSTVPTTGFPGLSLATGRLDTDQRGDVVVGGNGGIGTYQGMLSGLAARTATMMTSRVDNIGVGDVNGDGVLDIVFVVVPTGGSTTGQLGVLRGAGDGTFGMPTTMPIQGLASALDVRDLDGDGRDDVIAVRTGSTRSLLIARGRPDGMFEVPVPFPLPGSSAQLSARGSFNGDAVPDIVVTDAVTNMVYVFASNP